MESMGKDCADGLPFTVISNVCGPSRSPPLFEFFSFTYSLEETWNRR